MSSDETGYKILVGVDGSEGSLTALQWATALAGERAGSVTALMTWSYPPGMLLPVVGAPVVPADLLTSTASTKLASIVANTPGAELINEERVVSGAPRAVLAEDSEDHDVVVLGRTGNSRLKQIFVGSTAAYVVRHAEAPVVVVRDQPAPEQMITVAVDGSPSSIEALAWALSFTGAQVVAKYSHDERELDDLALDDQARDELNERAEAMLVEAVAAAVQRAGADPARVVHQVMQGDPRTTLVDQADPDGLLVLGAQGHSGIARWVLGSLADYAVQHAPGSVAVWR